MKLKTKQRSMPSAEADMTPMIDMTFQLIAFFMVLIKFSEAETSQKVQLPLSDLAKPPEKAPDHFITIQVTEDRKGIIRGDERPIDGGLETLLEREVERLRKLPNPISAGAATVIIRAHKNCPAGAVQEVIGLAQKHQFEKFALRAQYDQRGSP